RLPTGPHRFLQWLNKLRRNRFNIITLYKIHNEEDTVNNLINSCDKEGYIQVALRNDSSNWCKSKHDEHRSTRWQCCTQAAIPGYNGSCSFSGKIGLYHPRCSNGTCRGRIAGIRTCECSHHSRCNGVNICCTARKPSKQRVQYFHQT